MIQFKVTNYNSKLGSICSINLPAIKSCRKDAPCKKICYANKGNFLLPSVKKCYDNNLKSFLKDKSKAEMDIIKQLSNVRYCRLHASGDFINRDYFEMIVRIAKKAKHVRFMAFTKQYELINQYIAEGNIIPSNLKIIFSIWENFPMDNPYNLPTAFTKLKHGTDNRQKKKTVHCNGRCDDCFKCWYIKKGQQVLFYQH